MLHFPCLLACLFAKAKRASKVLGDTQERTSLDERIAACDAATQVATRLAPMGYLKLSENLLLLEPFAEEFPFGLKLKVIEKLYIEELGAVLCGSKRIDESETHVEIQRLVDTFKFWESDKGQIAKGTSGMTPEQPSFLPAVCELEARITDVGFDGEEDEAFQQLVLKQRSLERRASNESAKSNSNEDTLDDGKQLGLDVEACVCAGLGD